MTLVRTHLARTLSGMFLIVALAFTAVLGGAPAPTHAAPTDAPWTTSGYSGTVDEADYAIADLFGPFARVKDGAPLPATLDMYYNVVGLPGLFGGDGTRLSVTYQDTGSGARVFVNLNEYGLETGNLRPRIVFDSDRFPQATGYQTRHIDMCTPIFDFNKYSYTVHAQILKANANVQSGLRSVKISPVFCVK